MLRVVVYADIFRSLYEGGKKVYTLHKMYVLMQLSIRLTRTLIFTKTSKDEVLQEISLQSKIYVTRFKFLI